MCLVVEGKVARCAIIPHSITTFSFNLSKWVHKGCRGTSDGRVVLLLGSDVAKKVLFVQEVFKYEPVPWLNLSNSQCQAIAVAMPIALQDFERFDDVACGVLTSWKRWFLRTAQLPNIAGLPFSWANRSRWSIQQLICSRLFWDQISRLQKWKGRIAQSSCSIHKHPHEIKWTRN